MTLTIELKPELEARLQAEAAKTGVDTGACIVNALEERLQHKVRRRLPPQRSQEESELLQKINQGLPEEAWQEYHALIEERRAETLTPEEHNRLIALSDTIEEAHAERMANVAELALRRGVSLKSLLRSLWIKPRKV